MFHNSDDFILVYNLSSVFMYLCAEKKLKSYSKSSRNVIAMEIKIVLFCEAVNHC